MRERARRILGLALAFAFVAALFVLVLGIGFAINPPDTVGLAPAIFPAAATVLASLFGLVLIIRSLKGSMAPPLRRVLPRRRGPRVIPTEAQLDYAGDPARLATCSHLRAIERDIRGQGIPVRLRYGAVVVADCHVDEDLLRRRYVIAPPVYYTADMPGDRPGEPETALLSCREHRSVIEVIAWS